MTTSRRDVIKAGLALAGQSAVLTGATGVVGSLVGCGSGDGSIGPPPVSPPTGLSYAGPAKWTVGTAITPLSPSVTGVVTSYSVSPSLPAGLSLDGTSGQISGTPTAATPQANYTITAANSGGSTTYVLTLSVSAKLAIVSLSTSTPTAMTPLTVNTSGLDTSQPFNVSLQVGATNIALPVIRSTAAGAIVVATPLWIDPATGATSSVSGTITVTQGSATTDSTALIIRDLPPISTYGAQPGVISRSVLNMIAISTGRSLARLQALSLVSSLKTDSTTARAALKQASADTLVMRGNIDRIVAGVHSELVLGTDPASGATAYFNSSSIDVIDRILGLHLQAMGWFQKTSFAAGAGAVRGDRTRTRPRQGAGQALWGHS